VLRTRNPDCAALHPGYACYKVESTPTLFVNGKMVKGGTSIEEIEKVMAPFLKS
jgi:protein-disulfide isomerase